VKVIEPIGEYPESPVYKFYKTRKWAEDLAERGCFQMGSLVHYRDLEDAVRQDRSEGYGHIQVRSEIDVAYFATGNIENVEVRRELGLMHHHSEMGNPIFIFSTSLEGVDIEQMRQRFGLYMVCIANPRQFATDINRSLEARAEKFGGGVEGTVVRYDHGDVSQSELDHWDFIKLSYSQKPVSYSSEMEFRFVAINTNEHELRLDTPYLEVDLGGSLDYISLVFDEDRCNSQ